MLESFLENSRLAQAITQLESGESVDWQKVAELQALELARIGEVFALETIKTEREADDQFSEQLSQLNGN